MTKNYKISKSEIDNLSDEELMRLFIDTQNRELFSIIYQRYFVSLSKYLNWLIGDIEQAKDIAQNIFLKIHNRPSLFNTNENFRVWLFVIGKNQLKNDIRNQTSRKKLNDEFLISFEPEENEDMPDDTNQKKIRVKKAMKSLSENHREIIVLKYSNNLSLKEISGVLNCSEGTVKSRLFYALSNLKDLTKKE